MEKELFEHAKIRLFNEMPELKKILNDLDFELTYCERTKQIGVTGKELDFMSFDLFLAILKAPPEVKAPEFID